jgi:type I restriction enzyme S subunit
MTMAHVRIGDVLQLQRRPVIIEPWTFYEEIGVRSFGRGIFHKEPLSGADLGSKRVFRIEPGDLVISNVFAWEGAIAVASEAQKGRIGSHRFMTFVPTDGRIDTSWAAWFLRSDYGLDLVRKASPGSAGRNRTLAIDRFEAITIPLPPIDEQTKVAVELDRLNDAATALAHRTDRATKLTEAFVASSTTRTDLHVRTKLQRGWKQIVLGEILQPTTNQVQVKPDERYRIAGVYSFGRGLLHRKEILGAETAYKTFTVLHRGDVVISKLGGWEGAVTVVGPEFEHYCVSSEYPTFSIVDERCLPAFMAGITRSPQFWEAVNASTRGSMARRKRISSDEFLRVKVWLPPIETQERTTERIDTLDRANELRRRSRALGVAMVPAAMNQAFAGLS